MLPRSLSTNSSRTRTRFTGYGCAVGPPSMKSLGLCARGLFLFPIVGPSVSSRRKVSSTGLADVIPSSVPILDIGFPESRRKYASVGFPSFCPGSVVVPKLFGHHRWVHRYLSVRRQQVGVERNDRVPLTPQIRDRKRQHKRGPVVVR